MSYQKDSNVDFKIDRSNGPRTTSINFKPMISYLILALIIFIGISIIVLQANQISLLRAENMALQATIEAMEN